MKKTMKLVTKEEAVRELGIAYSNYPCLIIKRDDASLTIYSAPNKELLEKRLTKTIEGQKFTDITEHIQKALDGETVTWDD